MADNIVCHYQKLLILYLDYLVFIYETVYFKVIKHRNLYDLLS